MQNKIYLLCLLQLAFYSSYAQLPIINNPTIPNPTQTIYLDPNGSDSNPGTFAFPKKTFYAAISNLSFGIPNVNGGNAYGEVIFKSGDYYPTGSTGYTQDYNNWRSIVNGRYVYKNISVRGLGNVVLHGDSLLTGSQMIYLRGSGIKVSNIKIKNSKLHGVAMIGSNITHHTDVMVDGVVVDGAIDNGIWITGYDNVLVQNCNISNTCLRNYNSIGACQWASACRVENNKHASVIKNVIFNNWGEGLNMSLVRNAKVQDNIVYDNYSVNIYCNSTSNAIYSHNLTYNTDSTFWRNCVGQGKTAATGISITNELLCTNACWLYGNNCGTLTSCCSEIDDDFPFPFFQPVTYYQTDSVYVFNNIVLNASISVWDASSGFNNYANLTNFFISNNSVIGVAGQQTLNKPLLNIFLGTPFVKYNNVGLYNNIFSTDTTDINTVNLNTSVAGTCAQAWQTETFFNKNMWNKIPSNAGLNFSQEIQNSSISQNVNFNNLTPITPSNSNLTLVSTTPLLNYITDDFFHTPRNNNTNIGAIENSSITSTSDIKINNIIISPNPAKDKIYFNETIIAKSIIVYDVHGKQLILINDFSDDSIDISKLKSGIYFLIIIDNNKNTRQYKFTII